MDRFIRTNGLQLHYLEHLGGAPLIVLLPGLTANAHVFDGLIQAGLSPRFRVLALDLRGRGLSDAPAEGYTMANHAADVIGLLDALGIERATIAGHSFGGLLTFYLAAHYPARVTRLIVLDAAMSNATPATRAAIQPSLDRLGRVLPSWDTYLDAIKQAPYFDGWWDPAIESYFRADVRVSEDGSVQSRSHPEVIGAAMDGVIAEDWQAHLAAIRQPAILFQAPGDALAEVEHGLLITEEVLRHLITRDERPVKASRREDGGDVDETDDTDLLSGMEEDEDEDDGRERIGEDESEAAPAAID